MSPLTDEVNEIVLHHPATQTDTAAGQYSSLAVVQCICCTKIELFLGSYLATLITRLGANMQVAASVTSLVGVAVKKIDVEKEAH